MLNIYALLRLDDGRMISGYSESGLRHPRRSQPVHVFLLRLRRAGLLRLPTPRARSWADSQSSVPR